MATMFVRSLGLTDEVVKIQGQGNIINLKDMEQISDWAKEYVDFTIDSSLMNGTGEATFDPKGYAERQQAAVVTSRYISNKSSILEKSKKFKGKHPELYDAFRSSLNFKGEYSQSLRILARGKNSSEFIEMEIDASGVANGDDVHSKFKMIVGGTTITTDSIEFEYIQVGSRIYVKDFETGDWNITSLEELEEEGEVMPGQSEQISASNAQFLASIHKLSVEKKGNEKIDNEETTKYEVILDQETIAAIMPQTYGPIDLNAVYNNGFECKMDIYINSNNQIVKQVINFRAGIKNENEDSEISIILDTNYKKIGEDIKIEVPII